MFLCGASLDSWVRIKPVCMHTRQKEKNKKSWPVSCSNEASSLICSSSWLPAAWEPSPRAPGRLVAPTPEPLAQSALDSRAPCEGSGWAAGTDPARFHWLQGLLLEWLTAARLSETAFLCSLLLLNFTALLFLLGLFLKIFPSCILIW